MIRIVRVGSKVRLDILGLLTNGAMGQVINLSSTAQRGNPVIGMDLAVQII